MERIESRRLVVVVDSFQCHNQRAFVMSTYTELQIEHLPGDRVICRYIISRNEKEIETSTQLCKGK